MANHKKRRTRPLAPKPTSGLNVQTLGPTSFSVEISDAQKYRRQQMQVVSSKAKSRTALQIQSWLKQWQPEDKSEFKLTPKKRTIVQQLFEIRRRLERAAKSKLVVRTDETLIVRRTAADDLVAQGFEDLVHGSASNETKQTVEELRRDYDALICHAIRNGLENHCLCIEWVLERRALGDRKSLHRLHRTHPELERELASPPIRGNEKTILQEIHRLQLKRKKPLSMASLHRILVNRAIYVKPFRTFKKWISHPKRRWILENTSTNTPDNPSDLLHKSY